MTEEWKKWYFCKWNSDPFCERPEYEYCIYKDCGKYESSIKEASV